MAASIWTNEGSGKGCSDADSGASSTEFCDSGASSTEFCDSGGSSPEFCDSGGSSPTAAAEADDDGDMPSTA